jgi:hypothetical protein
MSQDPGSTERSANIFINYRREDTAGHAGRLFDRLSVRFPGRVFMDIDTLDPGVDFVEAIEKAVGSCEVLIVLIGHEWVSVKDAAGRRRLDDPTDFVRLEVVKALERAIRVIPVLVQGASMPRHEELPADLDKLTRRNAIELSDARWSYDADRLIHAIEEVLKGLDPAPPVPLAERQRPAPPQIVARAARPKALKAALLAALVLLGMGWIGWKLMQREQPGESAPHPSEPTPAVPVRADPAASAPTADEVIEKYIQAEGGREKLKAVQTVRMTGEIAANGSQAPFLLEKKRPHKIRTEFIVRGMTGVQAYDGITGWMVNPLMGKKDPEEMTAEDLKEIDDQADFDGPLVDYKAKGHQVELVGKENVLGNPAWKLKVTKKNGDSSYIYLDAGSYLEIKEENKRTLRGQEVESETVFGDYRRVAGIAFPFSLRVPAGMTLTVENVEINPGLDDARFAMP